ncbi:MAG: L-lysine 6-transaminase [Candidatus Kapaibacteriota bacterium]|jgi:L-lysine 6-transaminase
MSNYQPKHIIQPANTHLELGKHILADGFPFVLDLHNSKGARLFDEASDKKFLDFFTCFASIPVGMNHPKMMTDEFIRYIGELAVNKPSNSDIYTKEYAEFVNTLFTHAIPDGFKYSFFIEGGALAIENALKTAMDWKIRKNWKKGYTTEKGTKILHLKQAFHGRSGYTMSLTNTDPVKTALFPKFDFPRVTNPKITFPLNSENLAIVEELERQSIAEIKTAFINYKDDIAAIILEPIQGEGGDNHFRVEFFKELRKIADENEALLIFDEVQTGAGLTGTFWAFEQLEVKPDIFAFGKKMQVCGIIASNRIDDIDDHVFIASSRINSTWGGGLVDMVRATKYIEIIYEENMLLNAKEVGNYLQSKLADIAAEFPQYVSNTRGRGLFCAFDFSKEYRKSFLDNCYNNGLIILGCGDHSVRFRPALNLTKDEVNEGIEIITNSIKAIK